MLIHTSPQGGTPNSKVETPNVKKRHRRAKSGTNKNLDPGQDGGEYIVCVCVHAHRRTHAFRQSRLTWK